MSNGGEVSVRFSSQGEQQVTGSAAKIDAALQRLAAKEIKLQTSAIDQLNEKLKKLDAALAKNRLTQEQHAAAVARAQQEHQDKLNAPVARIQEQLDKAAAAKLSTFAAAIKSQVTTPLEQAKEEAELLDLALSKGLLSPAQHAAALARNMERVAAETNKAKIAAEELARAQRSAEVNAEIQAQIDLVKQRGKELDASRAASEKAAEDERRQLEKTDEQWNSYAQTVKESIRTPIQDYHAKLEKLSEAHVRGKLTIDEYHAAARKAFAGYKQGAEVAAKSQQSLGAGAVAAGSLVSQAWTQSLSTVVRLGSAMKEEHQRALGVQQAAGKSLGSLAQIAETPEEMQQLSSLARGLLRSGAAPDMSTAVNTVFDAKSSNSLGDIEQLRKLSEPGVISNLSEVIKSAASLRAAMGADSTGSVTDLLGKAFAAAGPSTASAEGILIGAARAGSQSKAGGVTVDELLAGTGVIATARGSAEEGGTRMAALLRGMESDTSLNDKSLVDRIRTIDQRKMSPEALTKELTAEGADAFRILANNLAELEATAKASATQVTAETIAKKQAIALSEKAVQVDMLARQAKAEGDSIREAEGRVVALRDAAIERGATERRTGATRGTLVSSRNIPFLRHMLSNSASSDLDAMMFGGAMDTFGAVPGSKLPESIAGSGRTGSSIREALTAAIAERDAERERFAASLRESADTMARAAASLDRAASKADRINPARREAAIAHGGG